MKTSQWGRRSVSTGRRYCWLEVASPPPARTYRRRVAALLAHYLLRIDSEVDEAVIDRVDQRSGHRDVLPHQETMVHYQLRQFILAGVERQIMHRSHFLSVTTNHRAALADDGVLDVLPAQRVSYFAVDCALTGPRHPISSGCRPGAKRCSIHASPDRPIDADQRV